MTDLSNAEKYTAQFGFEAGVVVEVVSITNYFTFGKFIGLDRRYMELYKQQEDRVTVDSFGYVDIPIREIKSLRLLSGPFRHWAEDVPDWAVACRVTSRDIVFYDKDEIEETYPVSDGEVETFRPWWCSKKETKNANGK